LLYNPYEIYTISDGVTVTVVSGHLPTDFIDATTATLKLTLITTHECIAHFSPAFEGDVFNRWNSLSIDKWNSAIESRRWFADIVEVAQPNPC
jgi:hypothetical protein